MAVLAGGFGGWIDHATEDNRRKARALAARVEHLEADVAQLQRQVAELQAALAARDEALAGAA